LDNSTGALPQGGNEMEKHKNIIDGHVSYWESGHGAPVRILSLQDTTGGMLFSYDSRCSACWLNNAHSLKYHQMKLDRFHTSGI